MEFLYISRQGDKEAFRELRNSLEKLNDSELIDRYNKQVDIGLVGVHQQALYVIALHFCMLDKLGFSPVEVVGGNLIRLGQKLPV